MCDEAAIAGDFEGGVSRLFLECSGSTEPSIVAGVRYEGHDAMSSQATATQLRR